MTTTKTARSEILKRTIIAEKKTVYNGKLETKSQETRKEKHTIFLNLKTYEDQAYQINLSQKNKSNECINSAQIYSKVTDVT